MEKRWKPSREGPFLYQLNKTNGPRFPSGHNVSNNPTNATDPNGEVIYFRVNDSNRTILLEKINELVTKYLPGNEDKIHLRFMHDPKNTLYIKIYAPNNYDTYIFANSLGLSGLSGSISEVFAAMVCEGRAYQFNDLYTDTNALQNFVAQQAWISRVAKDNKIKWPEGDSTHEEGESILDPNYWDSEDNLLPLACDPNHPEIFTGAILEAAGLVGNHPAELACKRAAALIIVAGITKSLSEMSDPNERAWLLGEFIRKVGNNPLSESNLNANFGLRFCNLPPHNVVPGDWGYIKNNLLPQQEEKLRKRGWSEQRIANYLVGLEGSNAIAVNTKFWTNYSRIPRYADLPENFSK